MNRCDQCGGELPGAFMLCPHHYLGDDPGWAATNRIMCDFVHRGFVPQRLEPGGREDDLRRCFHQAA